MGEISIGSAIFDRIDVFLDWTSAGSIMRREPCVGLGVGCEDVVFNMATATTGGGAGTGGCVDECVCWCALGVERRLVREPGMRDRDSRRTRLYMLSSSGMFSVSKPCTSSSRSSCGVRPVLRGRGCVSARAGKVYKTYNADATQPED